MLYDPTPEPDSRNTWLFIAHNVLTITKIKHWWHIDNTDTQTNNIWSWLSWLMGQYIFLVWYKITLDLSPY